MANWNIENVEKKLEEAFKNDSEIELLALLKDNTFLFSELVSRQFSVQPIFREVSFAGELRCDFAWLNDNSDGPEWVIVEIERPKMRLFSTNGKPGQELNAALDQVKSWDRYFYSNPAEKIRIFGAVAKFRFILVAGSIAEWQEKEPTVWRSTESDRTKIEIRSTDVFWKALEMYKKHPEGFWSFAEHPSTYPGTNLRKYWENYGYMNQMRLRF